MVDSLNELRGPDHGVLRLPTELAWSGRREFDLDLDDDYDCAAAYKIVPQRHHENLRELVNGHLLQRIWPQIRPERRLEADRPQP